MRRRARWLVAWGAIAACADLPPIEAGTCGNRVVEVGEDCDGFPKGQCRPAGTSGECRLSCSAELPCPSGMGCGTDSICRTPDGDFEFAGVLGSAYTIRAAVADFDGDRRDDVVAVESSQVVVHYLDEAARPVGRAALSGYPTIPTAGQLTEDGRADLVLVRDAMAVLRGRADRTLAPTAYSPFVLPPGASTFLSLEALPGDENPGHEMLLAVGNVLLAVSETEPLFQLDFTVDQIAGKVAVGNVWEDPVQSPCDELIVPITGRAQVEVIPSCVRTLAGWDWNSTRIGVPTQRVSLPPVRLPPGSTVEGGVLLHDANLDGHLDLLVGATGMTLGVHVAWGVGDGTFHSDGAAIPPASGDGVFSAEPAFAEGLPLAVGDLDGAPGLDAIFSWGAVLARPGAEPAFAVYNSGEPWSEVAVGDFNANGITDFVAVSPSAGSVEFYNGSGGGRFTRSLIPVQGTPALLSPGDYDGDLLLDLAIREAAPGGEGGDSLSILYGRAWSALAAPVSLGRLGTIDSLVPTQLGATLALDGATDLVVLSDLESAAGGTVALFVGSGDRELQSPFQFALPQSPEASANPLRAVIGRFDADDHEDVAVLLSDSQFGGGVPDPVGGEGIGGGFSSDTRLCLLPSTGDAQLSPQTATYAEALPDTLGASDAILASLDLDDDGRDEVILLAPSWESESERGAIVVLRSHDVDGLYHWQSGDPMRTAEGYRVHSFGGGFVDDVVGGGKGASTAEPSGGDTAAVEGSFLANGHHEVADVDGDGARDLVVLSITDDWETGLPIARVVVFLNRADGTLDVAGRHVIDSPPGMPLVGFTLVEADGDPELEIVLLGEGEARLAEIDLEARAFVGAWTLRDVAGGLGVASGDVNGDGIEDFVVAGWSGTSVFLGRAVLP
ncbi:MAG: VCBS repeat-containing protein [Polyangiaceae bacterium]|nr:VCBS repeat-containing protein [Polyangiaceae bacterium]